MSIELSPPIRSPLATYPQPPGRHAGYILQDTREIGFIEDTGGGFIRLTESSPGANDAFETFANPSSSDFELIATHAPFTLELERDDASLFTFDFGPSHLTETITPAATHSYVSARVKRRF